MKTFFRAIILAVLLTPCFVCNAANYTVTTTNDTGPGSLRAVLTTANGVAGPHTISFGNTGHFASGGTINLVSPLPVIAQSATIAGWRNGGSTNNAISVVGSPFVFGASTSNSLQQLNIGGSITNGRSISITGCVITNGGIQSTGVLQAFSSSVVASPTAGIWSSGNSTLNSVVVSLCQGGGIHNDGTMVIANSLIFSNVSLTDGGGIYSANSIRATGCQIVANTATNGAGGGVYTSGDAIFTKSIFANNQAAAGGGIFGAGSLEVAECLIAHNTVRGISPTWVGLGGGPFVGGGGGGGYPYHVGGMPPGPLEYAAWPPGSSADFGGSGGSAYATTINLSWPEWVAQVLGGDGGYGGSGGGVYVSSGNMTMTNCTVSGNTTIGGNGANGAVLKALASGGGGGGAGLGGGMCILGAVSSVVNCTIVSNRVAGGSGGLGGSGLAQSGAAGGSAGGGICAPLTNCTVLNTIISGNSSTTSGPDAWGRLASQGHNFIGNSSGSTGWNPVTDYQNAIPLALGPLQNNGGPTFTHALLPGSLCILAGTSAGAPLTDQRGVIRPLGKCDIGAYQYTTLITTSVTWANPAPIVYSTPLSAVQLNATANAGGTFTYIPPGGTVLNAGSNQVLTALFTPSDPTSYTGASNTVLITVLKTNQTITFPTIPPQTINAPPILLSATASSGLPVAYALISGDALLAGNLLSVGSTPGQVVVRASQAGNGNYLAAPDVDQSFLVVSGSKPSITTQPTNQTVDLGGNAAFFVAATTSPLTYQWQFQSLNMPGETNQSLSLLRVKASQAGPYRAIVSNPIGSVTSLVAVLTVNVPPGVPAITSQPKSLSVRSGETASFAVGAAGNATLVYQWYRGVSGDTNNPVGVNRPDYTTGALTANTSYWVSVRNSLGMVDSEMAWVTVVPAQTPKLSFQILAGFPVITLDGRVGTNYVIQYKNRLADPNWSPLLDFSLSANPFTYFDTTATGQTNRFYRAYTY